MLPLHDDNPTRIRPYVTWGLIAINAAVFVWQVSEGFLSDELSILLRYGEIPVFIAEGENLYTMFTSMFLHGDISHIFSNMLFLWVFGDNVEDRFGHGKYLFLYLIFGVIAGLVHTTYSLWISDPITISQCIMGYRFLLFPLPEPCIPAIGASGAVSGILGAYFVFYPRARVVTLVLFFLIRLIMIPAVALLGFWFLWQILQGLIGIGGNVAVWAHVGGFVAGFVVAKAAGVGSPTVYRPDVFDEDYYY
ncbi:MAG: rhomboid family intramembrane serine protease [Candidatus Geothermarchaeales archaeon]